MEETGQQCKKYCNTLIGLFLFALQRMSGDDFSPVSRMRASTITPGTDFSERKLPTVFKWEGGGKSVHIAGSFDNWKSKIPMVKR